LEQANDGMIHNIDDLAFGPTAICTSAWDEEDRRQPDGHVITKNFWSAILRIDPDKRPGNLEPNPHPAIPTNSIGSGPLFRARRQSVCRRHAIQRNGRESRRRAHGDVRAVGFRNPWQFSFDS
jgi:hypothetical protein